MSVSSVQKTPHQDLHDLSVLEHVPYHHEHHSNKFEQTGEFYLDMLAEF